MTNMEYYREQIEAIVNDGSGVAMTKKSKMLQPCNEVSCNDCAFRFSGGVLQQQNAALADG